MGASDFTRVVRLRADSHRGYAENRGTRCVGTGQVARLELVDHRSLFNHHQRRMHELVRGYERQGVAIFALHRTNGIAGHLWLEASATLRAGTIGRHSDGGALVVRGAF